MSKYYGDYHTHTKYSDSLSLIRENVEEARRIGLKEIGISDHGFNNYSLSLTRESVVKQRKEIEELRKEFRDITIYHSIEADLIGLDGTVDMELEEMRDFDYIIAGFHRWTKPKSFYDFRKFYLPAYMTFIRHAKPKEIARNTDATIKMLERYPIAIFPHMNSGTYVDVVAVSEACSDLGVFLELNLKHFERNIGLKNFEKIIETNVKMILSSDAHTTKRIGRFDKIEELIKPYNIDDRIVNKGNKTPNFRTINNYK